MFAKFRLQFHKHLFVNYNKYLRQLIDQALAGQVSETYFKKTSERYLAIIETHFQKAFELSRTIFGVPDDTLYQAFENLKQYFESNRFRKKSDESSGKEICNPPNRANEEQVICEVKAAGYTVRIANRYVQKTETEIQDFVTTAIAACTDPNGTLNGQALFLKLMDGYFRDECLYLAESLDGESPNPDQLLHAQMLALEKCHNENPFCFGESGKFMQFRAMVEQNLNPPMFYNENLPLYDEVAQKTR